MAEREPSPSDPAEPGRADRSASRSGASLADRALALAPGATGASQPAMTVLQVIPRLESGGAEAGAIQVAARLVRHGHRAVVVSEGGRLVPHLEAAGAEHVAMPVASKNPLTILANARRLARLAGDHGADLLHVRSRAPAWSVLLAARAAGLPWIATYHSDYSARGRLKRLYNSGMVRGRAVIAVSEAVADSIRRHYPALPEDRIVVVHRGVDLTAFDPAAVTEGAVAALRRGWGADDDHPAVLLAGRMTARKGHRDALAALARLARPAPILVFAGDGQGSDYPELLAAEARRLGVAERVRFLGHVDPSAMAAVYRAADIALNISSAEGFPRVALEAQAMGVPVIVSDIGPTREAVAAPPEVPLAEATGLRVPFADPESLAAAIARLAALPPEERRAIGARGAARVRSRWTAERMTGLTLGLYRAVLEREALAPPHGR